MVWLLAGFALLAQREFLHLLRQLSLSPFSKQVYFWTAAILLGAWHFPPLHSGLWIFLIAAISMITYCIAHEKPAQVISSLWPSLFALFYLPFLLQFAIILLRSAGNFQEGLWLLAWVVIVAKCSDIGGLLGGAFFGKHRLAKDYSPTKTWEGFVGSLILAAIGGGIVGFVAMIYGHFPLHFFWILPLTIVLTFVATISDLLESAFKREANLKDSGHLIPGIGGTLDFLDSLLLSIPAGYILFQLTGTLSR